MSVYSAHIDTFARDNLPPRDQWPDLIFTIPELQYPDRLNCIAELLDKHVQQGFGDRPMIFSPEVNLTYAQMQEQVDKVAHVLTHDMGLVPGNRVRCAANQSGACQLAGSSCSRKGKPNWVK